MGSRRFKDIHNQLSADQAASAFPQPTGPNAMQGRGPLAPTQTSSAPTSSGAFSGLDASPTAAQDMRAAGQSQMDEARKTLDDPMLESFPGARDVRRDARQDFRAGQSLRKAGMLAGRFEANTEKRNERLAAGEDTTKQDQGLDRTMGAAVRKFGAQDASELAGKMGDTRYTATDAPKREMSEFGQFKREARLGRAVERRDAAREAAGGMNYKQIEGTGLKAEQRRAAALVARKHNRRINQMLGKTGRKFGMDKAAELAENTGVNKKKRDLA